MGWLFTDKYIYEKDKKELVKKYCNLKAENIEYLEIKNNVAYMIYNYDNIKYGLVYLIEITNFEFGYKSMDITMCPYAFNCSKKFYNMVKNIYTGDRETKHTKEWLELWEKNKKETEDKKNKIKSLKVGDKIKFIDAQFGEREVWQVSYKNGETTLFNGYKLKGWKKCDFEIINI